MKWFNAFWTAWGSQLVIHALACLEQVNLMESIPLHANDVLKFEGLS